jgi:hypothetical protein
MSKEENLLKKERKLSKSSGVKYGTRATADLQYMRYGTDFMKCEKCEEYLGLWHCVRCALFKKRGTLYVVKCKSCGHKNLRKKGALSEELNERWDE